MTDRLSSKDRSRVMARVRGKNTTPEMVVRKTLHSLGYRFRLHRKDLPGHPDVVLPTHGAVVFVHGCFWHRHPGCKRATEPATNADFWSKKLAGNVARDAKQVEALDRLGWRVLVVWECETKDLQSLADILTRFLSQGGAA